MKKLATVLFVVLCTTLAYAQEEAEEAALVLDSPAGWGLEIMQFPLGFARSIDYEGFEEIRFAPKWKDVNSDEFWAYAFVWYLNADAEITSAKLSDHMKAYFDGIQKVSNSKAIFIELNDGSYVGSIRTFDRFTTKTEFVLNVRMTAKYCKEKDKYAYLFRIAPASFDNQVWNKLENVRLIRTCE